jgi:outer membrane protein TolC
MLFNFERPSMIRSALLAFFFAITACLGQANASDQLYEKLISFAQNMPEVLEASNEIVTSQLTHAKIAAEAHPKVQFSSVGNYPIASNLSSVRARANNRDAFLDGEISVGLPIYDFGQRSSRLKAEKFNQRKLEVRLETQINRNIFKILESSISILSSYDKKQILTEHFNIFRDAAKKVKLRYEGGVGTLKSVRRLDLIELDLQGQLSQIALEIDYQVQAFRDNFGFDPSVLIEPIRHEVIQLPQELVDYSIQSFWFDREYSNESQALDAEINSVRKSKWPSMDLKLTGVFYGVENNQLRENEILGGITISMPIYDAKIRDLGAEQLSIRKKIASQQRETNKRELDTKLEEVRRNFLKVRSLIKNHDEKIKNLEQRISDLQITSKATRNDESEIVSLTIELQELNRSQVQSRWEKRLLIVKNAFLFEQLENLIRSLPPQQPKLN